MQSKKEALSCSCSIELLMFRDNYVHPVDSGRGN